MWQYKGINGSICTPAFGSDSHSQGLPLRNRVSFQTHFLNVWLANGPRPSGCMSPKIIPYTTFFDQAYPTVFDPRDPQGHFSKKYFPAKIVLFVRYLSLESSKSFSSYCDYKSAQRARCESVANHHPYQIHPKQAVPLAPPFPPSRSSPGPPSPPTTMSLAPNPYFAEIRCTR